MDELRVVRREDQTLILAGDAGVEYSLVVDASVLAELRHLHRQSAGTVKINPREIQSLVRSGKTRGEIAVLTGADESDIERYEEPVLAERRFVLQNAQAVPVRTSPSEQAEQQFGAVIAERLIGLGASQIAWDSWRDSEAGWMIGLDFESHDVAHRAVWSFEHRKGVLAPLTPDAESLSRQGDLGDRLIPKLRAVDADDTRSRFDSDAFDKDRLEAAVADAPTASPELADDAATPARSAGAEAALRAGHPSTGSIPVISTEDEFARRREIDQRAIKTTEPDLPDLGQTADLLDALRRRRGAREDLRQHDSIDESHDQTDLVPPVPLRGINTEGARGATDTKPQPVPGVPPVTAATPAPGEEPERSEAPATQSGGAPQEDERSGEPTKRSRGRTSIPSWDDILFGTRSEEDPS